MNQKFTYPRLYWLAIVGGAIIMALFITLCLLAYKAQDTKGAETKFGLEDQYSDDRKDNTSNTATTSPLYLGSGTATTTVGVNANLGGGITPYFETSGWARARVNMQQIASSSATAYNGVFEVSEDRVNWFPFATPFSTADSKGNTSVLATSTTFTYTPGLQAANSTSSISFILGPIVAKYMRIRIQATGAAGAVWFNLTGDKPL